MTTTDETTTTSRHPSFCEGGIACEVPRTQPADWTHRGRVTTFHLEDQRVELALLRADGHSRGKQYERGEVEVELQVTETAFFDAQGNEVSVALRMRPAQLERLLSFLKRVPPRATAPGRAALRRLRRRSG